jgi:hypothetical protein
MTPQPLPPAPYGWNKTLRDLFEELCLKQRSSIEWPETEWALNYERSLLPEGTRFPRHGDIYEVKQPLATMISVNWHSPVTTESAYTLPAGTRVRVESATHDRPLAVNTLPVNYKVHEKSALNLWTRLRPSYGGYHITFSTRQLNELFMLVSSEA